MQSVLIIGGSGYIGTSLSNFLYKKGFSVTVLDTFWFGDFIGLDGEIKRINMDIRNIEVNSQIGNFDIVIHLADVANDPSAELEPTLTWEIGCLGTRNVMEWATKNQVQKIIVASSGSVYGISTKDKVCEDSDLRPISTYNKVKMVKEKIVESYGNRIPTVILRPATVAGVSPRQRLDLAVNILTYQALKNGIIEVFGGLQVRPHLHLHDMLNTYLFFIQNNLTGIYNVGFENLTILELAEKIAKITKARVEIKDSADPRSYRLCSHKILDHGFTPRKFVEDAIFEMIDAFESKTLMEGNRTINLTWMKHLKIQ